MLECRGLSVSYGHHRALEGVAIRIEREEIVVILGANGAGKTTLLKAIAGIVPAAESGQIVLDGHPVTNRPPHRIVEAGLALVPEGRGIFPGLTVAETLRLALWAAAVPEGERAARLDWVMGVLPRLREFGQRRAGTLSGGEQQMVSLGRALLSRPRCLLMDEPSIGLAPKLFQDLLRPIRELQQTNGMAILLVEQNVREALRISDRVVAMKSGAVVREALPAELDDNATLMELY